MPKPKISIEKSFSSLTLNENKDKKNKSKDKKKKTNQDAIKPWTPYGKPNSNMKFDLTKRVRRDVYQLKFKFLPMYSDKIPDALSTLYFSNPNRAQAVARNLEFVLLSLLRENDMMMDTHGSNVNKFKTQMGDVKVEYEIDKFEYVPEDMALPTNYFSVVNKEITMSNLVSNLVDVWNHGSILKKLMFKDYDTLFKPIRSRPKDNRDYCINDSTLCQPYGDADFLCLGTTDGGSLCLKPACRDCIIKDETGKTQGCIDCGFVGHGHNDERHETSCMKVCPGCFEVRCNLCYYGFNITPSGELSLLTNEYIDPCEIHNLNKDVPRVCQTCNVGVKFHHACGRLVCIEHITRYNSHNGYEHGKLTCCLMPDVTRNVNWFDKLPEGNVGLKKFLSRFEDRDQWDEIFPILKGLLLHYEGKAKGVGYHEPFVKWEEYLWYKNFIEDCALIIHNRNVSRKYGHLGNNNCNNSNYNNENKFNTCNQVGPLSLYNTFLNQFQ